MKDKIAQIVAEALGSVAPSEVKIEIPRNARFGDYSTNIALIIGKKTKQKPHDVAMGLTEKLHNHEIFAKVEIAGPGFVNFTLKDDLIRKQLAIIMKQDHEWGKLRTQNSKLEKVLLEFVSANPTGPLHVGHGRWAVIGDVIARILKAAGYKVEKEFYVNNVGNQIAKLVASVEAARSGQPVPEGGYGGEYIKRLSGDREIWKSGGGHQEIRDIILGKFIDEQKKTLKQLGVKFDKWFYENKLHDQNKVVAAIEELKKLGQTFEQDGALWFKSEDYGDDKNRVLVRADGVSTYFAADIAYHHDKYHRGYDHLIDIWGTDHHGYVARVKAAMQALKQDPKKLEIIIGQLVALFRGSEPVRMSKRTGEMVTLQELIDEIGADATRFFFAATDYNSHQNFDLELAKKQSNENPVYYVQYAHARICSILEKSTEQGKKTVKANLSDLHHPAERVLMLKLISWPDVIVEAARLRHPHRITEYGKELASVFHSFYEKCKVLGNPARLLLVDASRITLRNVLELLGISTPEKM